VDKEKTGIYVEKNDQIVRKTEGKTWYNKAKSRENFSNGQNVQEKSIAAVERRSKQNLESQTEERRQKEFVRKNRLVLGANNQGTAKRESFSRIAGGKRRPPHVGPNEGGGTDFQDIAAENEMGKHGRAVYLSNRLEGRLEEGRFQHPTLPNQGTALKKRDKKKGKTQGASRTETSKKNRAVRRRKESDPKDRLKEKKGRKEREALRRGRLVGFNTFSNLFAN